MNKRKLLKFLQKDFDISKTKNASYDFNIIINNKTYQLLVVPSSETSQLTINSPIIWEMAKGRINGIRYKKTSSNLLRLTEYNKQVNKLVYLTNTPYRILKYLNESDVIDISNESVINDIRIIKDVSEFYTIQ